MRVRAGTRIGTSFGFAVMLALGVIATMLVLRMSVPPPVDAGQPAYGAPPTAKPAAPNVKPPMGLACPTGAACHPAQAEPPVVKPGPDGKAMAPSPGNDSHPRNNGRQTGQQDGQQEYNQVTLITGDRVLVTGSPDDVKSSYRVIQADASSLWHFSTFDNDRGSYVVPAELDLARLDIELFNVKYLIAEGYHEMESLPVIIAATDAARIETIAATINGLGGDVTYQSRSLPVLAASLPLSNVGGISQDLLGRADVDKIWLDQQVHASLDASVPGIGAPQVWDIGFRGDGVEIAILDTGIDATHPDLDDLDDDPTTDDPKVLHAVDFTRDGTTEDFYGHGTHVAGTAAGTGEGSQGTFTGVAPGANLWNLRVLDGSGGGLQSWIIAGVEFAALGPDSLQGTGDESDVINMSFGADINGDGTDPISLATDFAVDQGLVVVLASGNAGFRGMFSVGQPASARKPITVGASDDADRVTGFSSQGPTADFRLKPDVVSPGEEIIAPCASAVGCSIVDPYISFSGTSMAAPHVSGAAALVRQAHPDWTPAMVKAALMNNALVLGDGTRLWEQGAGRINVLDAANTVLLAMEPSFGFGELAAGEANIAGLTLWNLSDTQVEVDLSVITANNGVESGLVSINPPSLTISAGAQVTASLTVGPVDQEHEGWYEGRVTAAYSQGTLTVPYLIKVEQESDISVTPSSFVETAASLQLLQRTLTIENTGAGELTYRVLGTEPPVATVAPGDTPRPEQSWGDLPDRLAEVRQQNPGPARDVIPIPESRVMALAPIITDPEGDDIGEPPEVDILQVDADASEEYLTLLVSFTDNTIPREVVGAVHLDTDQDPATGLRPSDLYGTPDQDIGADFFLDLFNLPGSGEVDVIDASFNLITRVPAEFTGQSLELSIPLTALGNDDGNMDVTLVLGNFAGPTDWAPDAGHGTVVLDTLPWLCFDQFSGVVAPGTSQEVTVTINCLRDLPLGTHTAEIVVHNNDPDQDPVVVPMTLIIEESGPPEINVTPAAFDPLLATGQVFTTTMNIDNILTTDSGVLTFEITDVDPATNLDAPWLSLSPISGLLDPGSAQKVEVTFDTSDLSVGEYRARITIANNDPDQDPVDVPVTMTVAAPDITVSPDSLAVTLDRNGITADSLTITNAGTGTLTFEAELLDRTAPATPAASAGSWATPPPERSRPVPPEVRSRYSDIPRGPSRETGTLAVEGVELLANDLFAAAESGFILRVDSDTGEITQLAPPEPISSGPDGLAASRDFLFFINGFGSNAIYKMTHDGRVLDVFPTPRDTYFADLAYNDGVLYGLDAGRGRIFAFDPDSGQVLDAVPGQTDIGGGLAPGPDGTLYVAENFSNVVQMDPATGAVIARIFESNAILLGLAFDGNLLVLGSPDGEHLLVDPQSGEVAGRITGLTGVSALTIPPASVTWLSVDPLAGEVPPGGTLEMTVTLDATDHDPGTFTADIVMYNNDPDEPRIVRPATLTVPPPDIEASPHSFAVTLDRNETTTESLTITNAGTGSLAFEIPAVDGLISANPAQALVEPGRFVEVQMTFRATDLDPGTHEFSFTVDSNAPHDSQVARPVTITVPPPDIEVSPNSLAVTLDRNGMATDSLTFTNAGTGTLVFDADLVEFTLPGTGTPTESRWVGPPPERSSPVPPEARSRYSAIPREDSRETETRETETLAVEGVELLANDLFAVADNGFILRVDSDTGETTQVSPPEPISFGPDGLAASRDFLFYINGFGSNAIYKMTHDGLVLDVFAAPRDAFFDGLAYNDGVLYGLDFNSGRIVAFDPDHGQVLDSVRAQANIVGGMAPGPDGTLYVIEGYSNVVQIDPATGAVMARIFESNDFYYGLAFDGTLLVLGSPYGEHLLVDPGSAKVVGRITGLTGVSALTIPPAGVPWLQVDPESASVPPGGTLGMTVTFDATDREPGTFNADIVIHNNDPDEPRITRRVAMTVLPPDIGVSPASFEVTLDRDRLTTDTLTITNAGPGTLVFEIPEVDGLVSARPSQGAIAPGEFVEVLMTFRATDLDPGAHVISFSVDSNDPDEPQVAGSVAITVPPPDIEVSPKSFAVTLDRNEITTETLTITNAGPGTLAFEIPGGDGPISAEPARGLVAPGGFIDVLMTFRATDLEPGTHEFSFAIKSNDLDESLVVRLVAITVSPPEIGISPKSFVVPLDRNEMTTETLTVTNAGRGTLVFEIPAVDGLIAAEPDRGLVAPGGFVIVLLSFRATDLDPGSHELSFIIESNDPDDPQVVGPVNINVPPPDIGVSPSSFAVTLDRNEVTTETLTITNAGPGNLLFEIPAVGGLIAAAPDQGLIAAGGFVKVSLTFRAMNLDPGTHQLSIAIKSNDPDEHSTVVTAAIVVPGTPLPTPVPTPIPAPGPVPTPTPIPVPPPAPTQTPIPIPPPAPTQTPIPVPPPAPTAVPTPQPVSPSTSFNPGQVSLGAIGSSATITVEAVSVDAAVDGVQINIQHSDQLEVTSPACAGIFAGGILLGPADVTGGTAFACAFLAGVVSGPEGAVMTFELTRIGDFNTDQVVAFGVDGVLGTQYSAGGTVIDPGVANQLLVSP